MKYDEMYPDAIRGELFKNDMYCSLAEGRCFSCGLITIWHQLRDSIWMCSEECEHCYRLYRSGNEIR